MIRVVQFLSRQRVSHRSGRLIDTFDAMVYPDDFEISPGSVAIHGITEDKAKSNGRPFIQVFTDFMTFIGPRTKTLVAHNAKFDTNVLRSEMLRHGINLISH
jgi:DNA polymerase III epsilon subunit-like protein